MGRSVSEKSDRATWYSEWMLCREMFSKKSLQALSARNRTWYGVGLIEGEEEDAPKQRGFRDEVDFRLGAIEQLMKEKERERERNMQKSTNTDQYQNRDKWKYVCMKNAWTCDMQK